MSDACTDELHQNEVNSIFAHSSDAKCWLADWHTRLSAENTDVRSISQRMLRVNPQFIPRNHLIAKAVTQAENTGTFTELYTILKLLAQPYEYLSKYPQYYTLGQENEKVAYTFCGT